MCVFPIQAHSEGKPIQVMGIEAVHGCLDPRNKQLESQVCLPVCISLCLLWSLFVSLSLLLSLSVHGVHACICESQKLTSGIVPKM